MRAVRKEYSFLTALTSWTPVAIHSRDLQGPCDFYCFKGQCTKAVLSFLEENNIIIAVVPSCCTDFLIVKAVKEFLRGKFQSWYSDQICQALKEGDTERVVDTRMSVVKPLSGQWLIELYDYIKSRPGTIVNGFHDAGIPLFN